jgi:RNase P subunit RPR2
MSGPRILNIDIETSPNRVYTWGTYNQFISLNQIEEPGGLLCFAASWVGEKEIIFKSVYHDGKEEMLDEVWRLLDEADAVMGWNSQSFDVKHINREFVEAGYHPPSPYKHIDLLKTARQNFKFLSNKLDYIAGRLDIGNKIKHSGFELWRDVMNDDPKAWALFKRYNKQDIKLVDEAYEILKPWINSQLNFGIYEDEDKAVCKNCGHDKLEKIEQTYKTKVNEYAQFRCQKCGTISRSRKKVSETRQNVLV